MEDQLSRWLALIQDREGRTRVVEEMKATGTDRVFPLLAAKLADPDIDVRCRAMVALLFLDAARAIDLVLPMLHDPEPTVRWHACACLHDFGDGRAVSALVAVLAGDPDPQVRGDAAYALGGIGSPAAIPALLEAMDSDLEPDFHGHSASSCAATALDACLGRHKPKKLVRNGRSISG
jgi:HEAT repeat protein